MYNNMDSHDVSNDYDDYHYDDYDDLTPTDYFLDINISTHLDK